MGGRERKRPDPKLPDDRSGPGKKKGARTKRHLGQKLDSLVADWKEHIDRQRRHRATCDFCLGKKQRTDPLRYYGCDGSWWKSWIKKQIKKVLDKIKKLEGK